MAVTTIPFALARARRSPIRLARRDLALQQGDTVTVQITVYDREGGSPEAMVDATARLSLFSVEGASYQWDYGQPVLGARATPVWSDEVEVEDSEAGRANIVIPASATGRLLGRYAYIIEVDPGGLGAVTASGILQVWRGVSAGLIAHEGDFRLDVSLLDGPDRLTFPGSPVFSAGYQYIQLRDGTILCDSTGRPFSLRGELDAYRTILLRRGTALKNRAGRTLSLRSGA